MGGNLRRKVSGTASAGLPSSRANWAPRGRDGGPSAHLMPGAWTTMGPAEGVAAACALAREAKAAAHTAATTVSVTWCFMGTSLGARRPTRGVAPNWRRLHHKDKYELLILSIWFSL